MVRDSESLSLGKSNGKKWYKIAAQKKFVLWLILPYKTCRNHTSRWIRDLWSQGVSLILAYFQTFLSFCVLDEFFRFSKKLGFWVFLVHPTVVLVLLSASVERCSRMRDEWEMYEMYERCLLYAGFVLPPLLKVLVMIVCWLCDSSGILDKVYFSLLT